MPRPKQDVTKESRIDVRMLPSLREALEMIAQHEDRTMSHTCERALRDYAIKWLKSHGKDAKELESIKS